VLDPRNREEDLKKNQFPYPCKFSDRFFVKRLLGSVWLFLESKRKMGFFSTILGFCGFGVGISTGLTIGYYLFIYFQPSDVKVIHNFTIP
jgi:hypothetical protein